MDPASITGRRGPVSLSVIVPVKDDARLEVCLRALAGQTLTRDSFEIVVVDNGPAESVRALAERFDARYVDPSPTAGRMPLAAAAHPWLAAASSSSPMPTAGSARLAGHRRTRLRRP